MFFSQKPFLVIYPGRANLDQLCAVWDRLLFSSMGAIFQLWNIAYCNINIKQLCSFIACINTI